MEDCRWHRFPGKEVLLQLRRKEMVEPGGLVGALSSDIDQDDIAHIQLIYLHRERHLGPERVDVAVEEYLPSWRLVGRQRGAFWDFQELVSLGDEIVSETDMPIEKNFDFLDRCEAVVTAANSA